MEWIYINKIDKGEVIIEANTPEEGVEKLIEVVGQDLTNWDLQNLYKPLKISKETRNLIQKLFNNENSKT